MGVMFLKYVKNILKGMAIGAATLVPGVSGGTMAIILGIYDDLIHSISSFLDDWKKNTLFLLEVGFGALLSMLLFSRFLENAVKSYPHIMQFLFMGIIIGGLPVLYRKSVESGKRDKFDFVFLMLGFAMVLLMSAEPEAIDIMAASQGALSMILLAAAGVIIAIALILPGISGSYMLLILGLYGTTLNAINTMKIQFLIPLGLGIAAGTLATTKIIEYFLQKYPSKTYMLIMGFVAGSLIPVFPGIPEMGVSLTASITAFIIGLLTILYMGQKGLVD